MQLLQKALRAPSRNYVGAGEVAVYYLMRFYFLSISHSRLLFVVSKDHRQSPQQPF
ncbi:hypothetical protein COCSUDRAFT_31997 [Coccomyxa subellipsoidea C-169]|uniref:Uncharacterized protein n=1 Tax=Coccomyxa subellipsoidea (strain C-169) TaxID=574566 RepID=I0Z9T2_COCSC|nr:hypothetical protein COCSUDRAFT_31997 [Coccomyxa subellipsoidea C-169]EIE27401.1 hypothetical protein COCSUDRAFT_31997 [Coccomyxa subellipsoidea C-169]|eukprot:XP_005651945.1 hypothetical protein COCSUDRAFT_31997 [Coccomyxa subellipsoidea C-169]